MTTRNPHITLPVTACIMLLCCLTQGNAQPAGPPADRTHQWVTSAATAIRTQQVVFDSAAAGRPISYHIYTPEVYDTEPARRFPVLYWLHGSGGGLGGIPPLARHFDAAIRAGRIPPMLVVFANGLPHSLWVDSKDGRTPVETVVVKELVPDVDANFRTIASREGRIMEGFSMGGYGAARFGLKYHDMFCAASILAGGPFHPDFTHTPRVGPRNRERILQNVFGGDREYYAALSPWRLAEENADAVRGRLRIRIVVGELDETRDLNRDFSARLASLDIPHTFTEVPGVGHKTMPLFFALGEENWEFYREALGWGQ